MPHIILENWILVILYILNDDLHVHHVKHISTSSGCTYDMAHSIYIRPCTHIMHPLAVAYAGIRWSIGPASENMAADLLLVQTLNIRLPYKVVEYAEVHKCC